MLYLIASDKVSCSTQNVNSLIQDVRFTRIYFLILQYNIIFNIEIININICVCFESITLKYCFDF